MAPCSSLCWPWPAVARTDARAAALMGALFLGLLASACAPLVRPAGPAVRPADLRAESVVMPDGMHLPLRVWRPEGEPEAVVLALHGFNDYSNAFAAPAATWAAQGIATYAYDQRGFGASEARGTWPGVATLAGDLRAVSRIVRAAHPDAPFFILGESMGGAVVMVAMAEANAPAVDGVILVAPAVWGREVMNPVYRALLWLGAHTIPAARVTVQDLHIRPSDNVAMLQRLHHDPLVIKGTRVDSVYGLVNLMDAAFAAGPPLAVPTLVLYGAHDQLVPRKATGLMLRRLDRLPRLAVYPGGYHMLLRDLEARTVLDDVAAWIADVEAPLPSASDKGSEAFFLE